MRAHRMTPSIDLLTWPHDRDHVRLLQQAHGDHIESMYHGMLALAGNPAGVILRRFGPTRTFIAAGNRLENRAIFTGEETPDEIDEVLRHFASNNANLVIEVNPANFYVDPPRTWEKRLLAHLLSRGCVIHDFRCEWCRSEPPDSRDDPSSGMRIERYDGSQIDEFIALLERVDPRERWTAKQRAAKSAPGWIHYIAFDGDAPVATGSLFINGPTGYLAWWYTRPDHRRRGFQDAGIRRRVEDAFHAGCRCAFTVTDFNFTSPRNLQRCGFRLAYNYLLLRREPVPVE